MAKPQISLLSPDDLQAVHDTTLGILRDVGVIVHNDKVLLRLAEAGANVDTAQKIARFSEDLVMQSLEAARKQYILYGREPARVARFGYGDQNLISSPGQFGWFDYQRPERRDPVLKDAQAAIQLGDALENITVVGAMAVPVDVPPPIRDVVLTAELVKHTGKPTRCWPVSAQSSRYVLEIYEVAAGGKAALRERPMTEMFLEPISPLQLPDKEFDILIEFTEYGQPASLGPMAMAAGTAPATLAGTLAQENAEILAGVVAIQTIASGTPIMYGGIPHIMDPRTSICAFGSPEQTLMALAMTEVGKHYGFPVYINVNLTDAKCLDVQAGMEKINGLVTGMMAGADLFGHAGIVGTDHGGNLLWLVIDDEAASFAKRIVRGFTVNTETLAKSVIADVGPKGHFLEHDHTLKHFRSELWIPTSAWTREVYSEWAEGDFLSMGDRAQAQAERLLETHEPEPLAPDLTREIERIVDAARRELVD
jgi:trimethylamine--corrinoid protein Co-methyltransferase